MALPTSLLWQVWNFLSVLFIWRAFLTSFTGKRKGKCSSSNRELYILCQNPHEATQFGHLAHSSGVPYAREKATPPSQELFQHRSRATGTSTLNPCYGSCISIHIAGYQSPQNHSARDISWCLACLCLVSPNYLDKILDPWKWTKGTGDSCSSSTHGSEQVHNYNYNFSLILKIMSWLLQDGASKNEGKNN